jgi:AcrR family transcriptional regulator
MSSVITRREASKEETREALLLAGLAEFAEKGLDAPSLDAICARAGFTRGAFYVHFRDREDFVGAAMERVLGPFLDAVIAPGADATDLARTVERFIDIIAAMGDRTGGEGVKPATAADPAWLTSPAPLVVGLQFPRLLEACIRQPRLGERFSTVIVGAITRLARTAGSAQRANAARRDVDGEALGTLLVTLALGLLVASEIGVPLDIAGARRALLRLIAA